jgi:hypothetical protein
MNTASDALRMANDPADFFVNSGRAAQHVPALDLAQLQLSAMQQRFAALRNRLPVLQVMAQEQKIEGIDSLDAVAPLLFPHTVYKSYPLSLLENDRFDRLTQWLGRLTTCDLSAARVSQCDGIDSWLDVLDRETPIRVAHSSGTTGTMSFLPRARNEFEIFFRTQHLGVFEFIDPEGSHDHTNEHFDVVWPTYTEGRSGTGRAVEFFRDHLAGSPQRFHPLIEGRMSADVMFLAGRLRLAAARGELDRVKVSPKLRARRAEVEETQRASKHALERLFEEVILKLEGKKVFLIGQMTTIHEIASAGRARSMRNAFAPGSVVQTGGGAKGIVLPPDWEGEVRTFAGVQRIAFNYGMTELNMVAYICEHGRYHIPPWIVLLLLDPDRGSPLPRAGVQTGRAAYFDLIPQTYWGGFVSGDEVTADWTPCACGRTTPHISRRVERYSEKRGGDDKISCAATEEAHQAALEHLTGHLA